MYTLSIDLGTTYTAAAVLDDSGVPAMVGLGNRAMQIPSVLYANPDRTFLVGEAAERQAAVDPTRVKREIKRRIGDTVPILIAGAAHSAAELTGHLLRWVVDRSTERYAEPPSRIVVTHPAAWRQVRLNVLQEAATMMELPPILMCPEPVAAAMFYASHTRVADGDRICVYDLGGGTFDVCVVSKTSQSFHVLGVPEGIDQLGGVDFDEAVFQRVLDQMMDRTSIDPADPGLYRLRRDCVDAKEALSEEVEVSITASLAGKQESVRLTRAEFEEMIISSLDRTVKATERALNSAAVSPAQLTSIVLVGGSSRIPLVTEVLTEAFRCPIAHDTHPKHDIALGAVLITPKDERVPALAAGSIVTAEPPAEEVGPKPTANIPRRSRILVISAAATATAAVLAFAAVRTFNGPASSTSPQQITSPDATSAPDALVESPLSLSTAISSGPADSTQQQTKSTEAESLPTSASPSIPAPPSFDATTISWLITACGAGADIIGLGIVPGTNFTNLAAAQSAVEQSYTMQASVARAAAGTLRGYLPAAIADGRIDPQATIDALENVADILTAAALSIQSLTPRAFSDIQNVQAGVNDQIKKLPAIINEARLSESEVAYIGGLRGC